MAGARYDVIGRTYAQTRRADPRIAAQINAALGDARMVVNVGAGTGSYEPHDRKVVAVEPSMTMVAQRDPRAGPAVQAVAESLPFANDTFDAALATLTMHHWTDIEQGAAEMRRVADRQVVLFFELEYEFDSWLVTEYFPTRPAFSHQPQAPGSARLAELFDVRSIEVVPVPADCQDGFAFAYWNRPEAYLDPAVQDGISLFAQLEEADRTAGVARLRDDLTSGAWDARHGALRREQSIDAGYRLLIAGG